MRIWSWCYNVEIKGIKLITLFGKDFLKFSRIVPDLFFLRSETLWSASHAISSSKPGVSVLGNGSATIGREVVRAA
jgi:hypothetical protein